MDRIIDKNDKNYNNKDFNSILDYLLKTREPVLIEYETPNSNNYTYFYNNILLSFMVYFDFNDGVNYIMESTLFIYNNFESRKFLKDKIEKFTTIYKIIIE